jgi:4-coumarate--CoA ligase
LHIDANATTNTLTKGGLITLTQRIAHGLRSQFGIGASGNLPTATNASPDVVTVISHGQILVPALFYGVIAAGGVYSAASPSSTPAELARQIALGKSATLVCGREFVPLVRAALAVLRDDTRGTYQGWQFDGIRVLVLDSTPDAWSLRGGSGAEIGDEKGASCISAGLLEWQRITDPELWKQSLVVILWSSGTTGLPKGVMLSHANLVAETYLLALPARLWAAEQVAQGKNLTELFPEYRTLAHLPISHIAGLFGYLIGPTYGGGTVIWMRKYVWKEFYTNVSKFKITALYTVPSIFLRVAKSPEVKDHFKTVEMANTGAAPMDGVLQKAANSKLGRKVGGEGKEDTMIGQTWGLSETTGAITSVPKGEVDDSGCIGWVMPNVEIRYVCPLATHSHFFITHEAKLIY